MKKFLVVFTDDDAIQASCDTFEQACLWISKEYGLSSDNEGQYDITIYEAIEQRTGVIKHHRKQLVKREPK